MMTSTAKHFGVGATTPTPPEIPGGLFVYMPCKVTTWQGIAFFGEYMLDRFKELREVILEKIAELQTYCSQKNNGMVSLPAEYKNENCASRH